MSELRGAGALLVVGGYPDKYVFVRCADENHGKSEQCRGYESDFHEGMFEGVSGAIDGDESGTSALVREFEEERGITITPDQIRWLDNDLTVHQFRPDKGEVDFCAALALITLTSEQLAFLLVKHDARVFSKEELGQMNDGEKELFRPFTWAFIGLVNDLGSNYD